MEGAIKQTADNIIHKQALGPDVEAAVRLSFVKHLAQVNDKDEFVRLTSSWPDLPEKARPVLERFIDERLLVKSARNGQIMVQVAHEAMFRCWDILRDWLHTSADILRWRRDVRRDQEIDRQNNGRWSGLRAAQLEAARDWPRLRRDELTDDEVVWIKEGIRRRWRRRGAVLLVVIVVFGLAVFALQQSSKARKSRDVAVDSLTMQLGMFTKPLEITGKIAAAVTTRRPDEVGQYLKALTNPAGGDKLFVKTPQIDKALAHLEAAIESWDPQEKISWNPAKEPSSEAVRKAVLHYAGTIRQAWKSQNLTTEARSLTGELIVGPSCERAVEVTRRLAEGTIRQEDKDEFEQLYWSELVFLETTNVAGLMVAFRRKLLGNPAFEQTDLKKIAAELQVECPKAMALSDAR